MDYCCKLNKFDRNCACDRIIYQVRPYTYEILRAIQPFFEMVATSNLPHYLLENIIEHMEHVLNKPITDMQKQYKDDKEKGKIMEEQKRS